VILPKIKFSGCFLLLSDLRPARPLRRSDSLTRRHRQPGSAANASHPRSVASRQPFERANRALQAAEFLLHSLSFLLQTYQYV
jgi:hypothetical protein